MEYKKDVIELIKFDWQLILYCDIVGIYNCTIGIENLT